MLVCCLLWWGPWLVWRLAGKENPGRWEPEALIPSLKRKNGSGTDGWQYWRIGLSSTSATDLLKATVELFPPSVNAELPSANKRCLFLDEGNKHQYVQFVFFFFCSQVYLSRKGHDRWHLCRTHLSHSCHISVNMQLLKVHFIVLHYLLLSSRFYLIN